MTTLYGFGDVLGRPLDTSFGLSYFHGQGPWDMCEVALRPIVDRCRGLYGIEYKLIKKTLKEINMKSGWTRMLTDFAQNFHVH